MSEIGKNYVTPELERKVQEVEMTVFTALGKRKTYLDRLMKLKTSGTVFCGVMQSNAKDINGMTVDEFMNKCKSNYDKVVALIRNFYAINAAITQSNATTKVVIAGKEYTVAEAIVRYDRLNNEIEFLNAINESVTKSRALITKANTEKLSEKAISDYVTKMLGTINMSVTDDNASEATIIALKERFTNDYIEANTYKLVDPYDHAGTIEQKMEEINEFITKFNEAINICNISTVIKVNLVED